MNPLRTLGLIVAGLIIFLTFFLVQAMAPDAPQHRPTNALQAVILHNAALQRDVLRARAGLLRTYDPLVQSMENLLGATADLAVLREVATGDTRADIDRRIDEVTSAVSDQEALVEAFKSDNALLQNSLAYFNHLSDRLGQRTDLSAEIGALTAAMLRFVNAPLPDAAREVRASLDRLAQLPVEAASIEPVPVEATGVEAALASDVRSLVSHGRLVLTTLPAVDALVARLQSAPTNGRARALQNVYFEASERAAARADLFLTLLYVAALALVAYVAYLFVRLRANAQRLRERLEFESLIASISTQFINLPRDRIRAGIGEALARLVEHSRLDGAQIVTSAAGEPGLAGSFSYRRPAADAPETPLTDVAEFVLRWRPREYERQGCICVPDVRSLPQSAEKAFLQTRHVQSWLCIPMRVAGECLGVLALDAVTEKKRWQDDDVALLRTAAEIFANAIARESSEIEREALQARLNQSQRLEAIGTLAGGIAHEFNNILGAIRGYGEMALGKLRKDSRARRYVEQIMKAGERAQDVVEQVLAFGRRRERQRRPIRVQPVVAEAIDLIRASFPSTLSVRTRLEAGHASMMGDPTELQQVVMNLGTNAAQAMNGRGVLTLALDTVDSGDAMTLSHGGLPAGRYVRLLVRDTGCGINQATLERIFEPFFTTKRAGEGTGLGLSTVHGIVAEHSGAINVKSRPGEGTVFEVYLPRTEDTAAAEARTPEPPLKSGHGETVLIVDDDRPLVLLGEEMLAALGYEPVGFDRSGAALAAFGAEPKRFDLVLTDELMPGMTGTELAGAMHEMRPDVPIVLMTGYEHSLQSDRLQAAGVREVLKKPLLSRALADCLARQLPVR
jgi:signal transduction histidine kinase